MHGVPSRYVGDLVVCITPSVFLSSFFLVLVHLEHPALGLLVVQGLAEGLGLGPQRGQRVDLLVDRVLQLAAVLCKGTDIMGHSDVYYKLPLQDVSGSHRLGRSRPRWSWRAGWRRPAPTAACRR